MDQRLEQRAGRRFGAVDDPPPFAVPPRAGAEPAPSCQVRVVADAPE